MQGIEAICEQNNGAHPPAGFFPNLNVRRVISTTCEAIVKTVNYSPEYRDNQQRADDFAFGYIRGVLQQLRESQDPATSAFAGTLLTQVHTGGIATVREILAQVIGRN